jgi:NHLM bacteriocin system ABC transporter ATP-binding protein
MSEIGDFVVPPVMPTVLAKDEGAAAIDCAGAPVFHRVLAGAVDLLFTAADPGGHGAQRPACRLAVGDLFMSAALPDRLSGWRARFVPVPGTRCQRVPGGDELVQDGGLANWLGSLVRACRIGLVPPNYRELPPAVELALADGESCVGASPVNWVEVIAGQVSLMGDEELRFAEGELIGLHGDAWLVARGPVRLRHIPTPPWPRAAPALAAMHDALQCALIRRWAMDDAAEVRRLQNRRTLANRRLGGALHKLVSLLDPVHALPPLADDGDSVLAACRLVGAGSGMEFFAPSRVLAHLAGDERLAAVVDAAGVRKRRVALRGSWWREDCGPLVAFSAETGEVLALLPVPGGGYRAVFPVSGQMRRVDADLAATLRPHAQALFQGFPPRPLGVVDLLRLGTRGLRREGGLVMLMAILIAVLGMLAPLALGHLFDRVIPAADRGQLAQLLAALAGAAIATLGFSLFRAELTLRFQGRMEMAVQAAVWDRVLKLPARFFRDYSAGDLGQRINAINQIHQELSGATLGGLLTGVFAFMNLALLFSLAPRLALTALALVAVAVLVNGGLGVLIIRRERQRQEAQGKLSGLVLELLTGIAKLRVAAAESRGFARWANLFAHGWSVELEARRLGNLAQIATTAFSVIAAAVIFDAAAPAFPAGESVLTTGRFVAFIGVFTSFFLQFISLTDLLLSLLHVLPQLERARPILVAEPESDSGPAGTVSLRGAVAVSNLCFHYQPAGPAILDGVSFALREGEFLAVVGPSGSGKSTLMRLLLGFERSSSGTVSYDGKDLGDLNVSALRRQMGVVLQSGQLMPGDIYSNIVGAYNLTVDDAWEAARRCGLDADIEAMPMGMHTLIGEGATTLSGGQRQRILIARAIVRRPRLLLFDEATSALDNRTQEIVSRSVERLKATRIVIAHRLSTIVNADRILVLERGRVVQSGTYAELMEQPGLFRELASRQLA